MTKFFIACAAFIELLIIVAPTSGGAVSQGTAFTYQGRILRASSTADVWYAFCFRLYDDPTAGNQVGPTLLPEVLAEDGVFSVDLDFGPVFRGGALWMEVQVREINEPTFTTLSPRQRIVPAPGAQFAEAADHAAPGEFAAESMRVDNLGSSGKDGVSRVSFGSGDNCYIGVDPNQPFGLAFHDPAGVRIIDPLLPDHAELGFGNDLGNNNIRIFIDPLVSGLNLDSPNGVRVRNLGSSGKDGVTRIAFGESDLCRIEADPNGPAGLAFHDPAGVRIINPIPGQPTTLSFGDDPNSPCAIYIDPALTGMTIRDPAGLRLRNLGSSGKDGVNSIRFGSSDNCRIETDPNQPIGIQFHDEYGVAIISHDPITGIDGGILTFGPSANCRISTSTSGLCFSDPTGFKFAGGFVNMGGQTATVRLELPTTPGPDGTAIANQFVDASSRRWKENIRPIDDALDRLNELQGVYFDWKADHGGGPGVGFIAEEVGRIYPELVAWEDNGVDAKGVSYDHLVAVAVEGIKAQQSQIDDLSATNADMQTQVTALQQENAELRAQLEQIQRQLAAISSRLNQRKAAASN